MIARIELDGTLGDHKEYGCSAKSKLNAQKDSENLYDLDDQFIDDGGMNKEMDLERLSE